MTRTMILSLTAGLAAAGAVAFLSGFGPGESGSEHTTPSQPEGGAHEMTPEEEMAMWMKSSMPGPQHAALDTMVGTWTAETSFVMDPNAEPMTGEGAMTVSWVLGGRYLKSEMQMADMMGMPFTGLGFNGYDNNAKEYVGVWMDTMGTGIMHLTGQKKGDTLTMEGQSMSPMGPKQMRIVTEWIDEDHVVDTFYDKMPDGSWHKSGQISYTRD